MALNIEIILRRGIKYIILSMDPVYLFLSLSLKNCVSPETTAHCRFGSGLICRPLPIPILAVANGGLKPLPKWQWAVAYIYGHCRNGNGRWFPAKHSF